MAAVAMDIDESSPPQAALVCNTSSLPVFSTAGLTVRRRPRTGRAFCLSTVLRFLAAGTSMQVVQSVHAHSRLRRLRGDGQWAAISLVARRARVRN